MHSRRRYPRSARSQPRRAALQAVVGIIALIGSLVVAVPASAVSGAPVAASSASSLTEAATVDSGLVKAAAVVGFNPENIISDALFYDGNAMSGAEIQSFLDSKIGRCENGKCLNVLTASISSRDAWYSQATGDLVCSALQGGTMRVSELIYRVQVACGISAKAILVTLQKEQGLTTSSAPSDWNLRAAMGASCPDTAPCDPAYSGVGPQIVQGVRQLKIYKAGRFGKQPGANYIGYNPNSSCGGTNLNIRNYATAALYNYTPYQPNAASLAAGWGIGDGCSSYGNRNFYNYYTSWFGSTGSAADAASIAISSRWQQNGGATGLLGSPLGPVTCGGVGGGCFQDFQNGAISWTASTGAWETHGEIRARWRALRFETGVLGYPVGAPTCGDVGGGCFQDFQNGAISWTASTGAWETQGEIRARWRALRFETGVLGYPVGAPTCGTVGGGCYQNFQKGAISWTATTGAWETYGPIRSRWAASRYETGALGYPTSGPVDGNGGVTQVFQGGAIFWSPSGGAVTSTGDIGARWIALSGAGGALGAPSGEIFCGTRAGGCFQDFQNGAISWTAATGAWETFGPIRALWRANRFETGVLGYPTDAPTTAGSGVFQKFEGGTVGWSPGAGAYVSTGSIEKRWLATDGMAGPLGAPLGAITCGTLKGGCFQNFENGAVSYSPAGGTWETYGAIRNRWRALGFETGALGYPTGAPTCGTKNDGCFQEYQNGAISWTQQTGAWETFGDIRSYWRSQGFETGRMGYPVGPVSPGASGGLTQSFQGGTATAVPGQGVRFVPAG